MKVLAVNSSPRTGSVSKTELMLDCLADGMREKGANVEVINLRKLKINYCVSCFVCWTKTPGVCVQKDDMTQELFPKYLECDLLVLATPLYHYTVNALMKTFIERTLPIVEPFLIEENGVTTHPNRQPPPPVVVLSGAGFPEASVFDQLRSYVRFLFHDTLVAEIYRPVAELLRIGGPDARVNDVLEGLTQGGRELVETGGISSTTLQRIEQPLADFSSMAPALNRIWQRCIDQEMSLAEYRKKGRRARKQND